MTKQEIEEIKALIGMPEKRENIFTRYVGEILVAILTATILFCATFIYNTNSIITDMSVQLKFLTETTNELKKKADDNNAQFVLRRDYDKASDAMRTIASDHEARLRILEGRRGRN